MTAGKRLPGQKLVGGYVHTKLKDLMKRLDMDTTTAIEFSILHTLLTEQKITKEAIRQLVEDGDVRDSTVTQLVKRKML